MCLRRAFCEVFSQCNLLCREIWNQIHDPLIYLDLNYKINRLFPLISHVGKAEVLESTVNRMGMSTSIFVKSDYGMTEFLATDDHPSKNTTPMKIQGKDLNR